MVVTDSPPLMVVSLAQLLNASSGIVVTASPTFMVVRDLLLANSSPMALVLNVRVSMLSHP